MILTVSGWRDWSDIGFAIRHLYRYHSAFGATLFWRVGCARGVDKMVREFLVDQRVPDANFTVYRADWNGLGEAAGPIRNGQMLRGENVRDHFPGVLTDRLLAFPQPRLDWRKARSGTVGCILDAASLGVYLDIPGYKAEESK